jgi:hypothetical protein
MAKLLFKRLKNFDYKKHSLELVEKIDKTKLKTKVTGEEGAYKGFVDVFKKENFIYIQAYKQYSTIGGYFDGNPKELTPIKNINGEYHSILITNSGEVLTEISHFFHNEDIRDLLINLFKSIGLHNVSIVDTNQFDIKTMRSFYKTAKKVILLKIQQIGEIPPNPRMPPEDLEKAIQDMAEGSNEIQFNSGRDKNIKESQIVNEGLARRSNIKEIRGLDEEGDTFTINSNGRIDSHLPEDSQKRANKLYKMVQKILGIFY